MTKTGKVNALLTLQCFQSSRLEARINASAEAVLFDAQDKNYWNQELINKGNYYLVGACSENEFSKYHLEASFAYWHTIKRDNEKWKHILQLYNQLILLEYSPITALNRAFAFAKVYGNEKGIQEAEKLNLTTNNHYYSLLGYLYADTNTDQSINHYQKAITLTKSKAEIQTLTKEIKRLTEKK